ncbi:LysM peptidoglycan-binding domain-containing protein [Patescibacteria group bacterium]|nr:LysM peptidoglycan-binding domain-containing protein [Patescibacteria group bacterium]
MVVELLINDDVYIETYGPPSRPAFSNGGYLCRDDIDAEGIWKITLVIGVDSPASIERVVYEVDPPPDNDVPISADDEEPCSCWAGKPMLGDGDRICNDQSKWSYCECEKLSSEDSADVDLGGWRHTEEPCVSADADDTPPSPPPAPVTKIHIVQRGENLYRISLCYGVTVEAIQVANGIVGTNIYVGQQLMIP